MPAVRAVERSPAAAVASGRARVGGRAHGHALDVRAWASRSASSRSPMPAFGEVHGSRAQGGFALSCFALGSLLGGLWIGTRPPSRRLAMRFALALARARARARAAARRALDPRDVRAHADRRHADRPGVRGVLRAHRRAGRARNDDRGLRPARHRHRCGPLARNVRERRRHRATRPDRGARAGRALRRRSRAAGGRAAAGR